VLVTMLVLDNCSYELQPPMKYFDPC
jgi:hypothetical protein